MKPMPLKRTPANPRVPFANTAVGERWVTSFVAWYIGEHRHKAIRVTLDERHDGRERGILEPRHELLAPKGQLAEKTYAGNGPI